MPLANFTNKDADTDRVSMRKHHSSACFFLWNSIFTGVVISNFWLDWDKYPGSTAHKALILSGTFNCFYSLLLLYVWVVLPIEYSNYQMYMEFAFFYIIAPVCQVICIMSPIGAGLDPFWAGVGNVLTPGLFGHKYGSMLLGSVLVLPFYMMLLDLRNATLLLLVAEWSLFSLHVGLGRKLCNLDTHPTTFRRASQYVAPGTAALSSTPKINLKPHPQPSLPFLPSPFIAAESLVYSLSKHLHSNLLMVVSCLFFVGRTLFIIGFQMYCSEDATFSNAGRNISPSENFIAIIAAMYLGSAEYQQVILDLASAREVLNDVFPASIASQVVLRSSGSTASLHLPPISCPSSPRGLGENLRPASNSRRFAKGIRRPSYSFLFDSSQGIKTKSSSEEEKTDMTKESLLMSSSGLEMEVDLNDMQKTAQLHPSVTVLFADIVGFTDMAGQLNPQVVMQLLNSLFSKFDQLSKEMMVYKVETIGDCYMCATGLQHDDPDHARTMVRFALAMQDAANQVLMPTTGMPVKIRVGIHSGSVLSGIVGTLRMRWCLFGDTVNTASRMESTGSPGRIQISSSTYEMICARAEMDQELCLESRGILSIKGKGDMETYFVEKRNKELESC